MRGRFHVRNDGDWDMGTKIDVVAAMFANPRSLSDEQLSMVRFIVGRELLERRIDARFPLVPEEWVDVLDAIDSDPDLEPDADDEDGADQEDENEHGGAIDDEPHDAADCGDDEPFLGWPEEYSLYDDMAALGVITTAVDDPNDTDALPLVGSPLDFTGDGKRQARELIRKAQTKAGYWTRRNALRR